MKPSKKHAGLAAPARPVRRTTFLTIAAILVLFEVANRKNAEAWLDKQQALGHPYQSQFLQTA